MNTQYDSRSIINSRVPCVARPSLRRSIRNTALLFLLLSSCLSMAQETLLPLSYPLQPSAKSEAVFSVPFFDDFSSPQRSQQQWFLGGSLVNQGYAPLPPTLGMATLDGFDAQGRLYASEMGQLYSADTLLSMTVRLDSAFSPYPRQLTPADSLYLSFFYLPGGGYGNMWERVGDVPESQDSLILEFFSPADTSWHPVWSVSGLSADTLFARTGSYWQFQEILIDDPQYFSSQFRFRFRNYCSLDINNKKGLLSNSDQWNLDYLLLDAGRRHGDSTARDVAFVSPAPSMLRRYQAMPARQYTAAEMADSLALVITNRFSEELATEYGYTVYDAQGNELYAYDGGHENAPVYWNAFAYQSSAAHARPAVAFAFPPLGEAPADFLIRHHVREGVSGDSHPTNDTISFLQHFSDYYAYDDGTAENGYGITSTSATVKLACRFDLNVEDTLTALDLYFNRTYKNQNEDIRFYISVWDDAGGRPGNLLYRDQARRSPRFEGFNRFVRYTLDSALLCSGTIYVGLEQTSNDYINLGFDRNCDASANILYRTAADWQTSILRGALMLRPCFGAHALLALPEVEQPSCHAYLHHDRICLQSSQPLPVQVCNTLGQVLFRSRTTSAAPLLTPVLPRGLYLVRFGTLPAIKLSIP